MDVKHLEQVNGDGLNSGIFFRTLRQGRWTGYESQINNVFRDGDQVLHTGRHVYRLSRVEASGDGCRYHVVDDDDDSFEIGLELAERDGLTVPHRITVHAWLTGWIELVEPEAP